jgi:hypothetical protein
MTGSLQVVSSTGGLLCLSKPLIRGTRIKVMFLTQRGPVLGSAEMLSPVSWTEQPFRFLGLAYGDQRRLQAITGNSSKLESPTPAPAVAAAPTPEQPPVIEASAPEEWISKFRAAVSQNPPRKPLFERMLEAIRPETR